VSMDQFDAVNFAGDQRIVSDGRRRGLTALILTEHDLR